MYLLFIHLFFLITFQLKQFCYDKKKKLFSANSYLVLSDAVYSERKNTEKKIVRSNFISVASILFRKQKNKLSLLFCSIRMVLRGIRFVSKYLMNFQNNYEIKTKRFCFK